MATNGQTTVIESLGVYLPSDEVSSRSRVKGIDKRIWVPLERFTGIKSTRRARPDEYSFDLACRAIEQCLARSRFLADDVGLVIACNICKYDHEGFVFPVEPATATRLCVALGITNAMAFDINNACAGMFTGILVADAFLRATGIDAAIVVSGEYISHISDTAQREIDGLNDPRLACLTLGDAGAAVMLARSSDHGTGFHHIGIRTVGAYSSLCTAMPTSRAHAGCIMLTDSTTLLKVGSQETADDLVRTLGEQSWDVDTVDHVIPHQVSKRATDGVLRLVNAKLGGSRLARDKVFDNIAHRGNTASTSHFVALHDAIEGGRIDSGDRVVFTLTASGLTVGTALYVIDDLPLRIRNGRPAKREAGGANGRASVPRPAGGPASLAIAAVATTRARRRPPSSTEEMAVEAAEACLAQAPCGRQDIDMLIFTGVFKSGFVAEPATASILAGRLGLRGDVVGGDRAMLAFDLYGGPLGFLKACEVLRVLAAQHQLTAGLVIAAEFDNNRLLDGYPRLGIAEVASAAVITAPGTGGTIVDDVQFFSFREYQDRYRANLLCVEQAHLSVQIAEDYHACLRECIGRAVRTYLAQTGRVMSDYGRYYFPQVSPIFLHELASDLGVPCERMVDATIPGKDLYTSSLLCALEQSAGGVPGAPGEKDTLGLAVSAGPGITVGCATLRVCAERAAQSGSLI